MTRRRRKRTLYERIDANVVENGDCLIWQAVTDAGRPVLTFEKAKKSVRRVMWERHNHKQMPEGLLAAACAIDKLCVNGAHLPAMTKTEIGKLNQDRTPQAVKTARAVKSWKGRTDMLTNEQLAQLREMTGSRREIAAMFPGMKEHQVSYHRSKAFRNSAPLSPWAGLGARNEK